MPIAIAQPHPKDSALDEIAKALSIATTIYGVKMDRDKVKALTEQAAAEKAAKTAEKNRTDAGIRTEGEAQKMATEGGRFLGKDETPRFGEIKVKVLGQGDQVDERRYQPPSFVKDEQTTAREEKLAKIRADQDHYKMAIANAKDDQQKQKIINEGARKLGDAFVKEEVAPAMVALKKLDKAIGGLESETDIPGIGGMANMADSPLIGDFAKSRLSEEGKSVRMLADGYRNALLKIRSGGSVTDPEAARLADELGRGVFATDKDFRRAMINSRDFLRSKIGSIEATADQSVVETYRQRAGSVSSLDPFFESNAEASIAGQSGKPGGGRVIEYEGKTYSVDANGDLTEVSKTAGQ
jgi:hypothetical protein